MTKPTYLDRLLPDKKTITLVDTGRLLNYPIFKKSLFVKSLDGKLKKAEISHFKFRNLKAVFTLAGFLAGLAVTFTGQSFISPLTLVTLFTFSVLGFSLPDLYLLEKLKEKDYEIHTNLPNLLDLLTLYAGSSAFENFKTALYDIAKIMPGALGEELKSILSRCYYVSLEELLSNLEKRINDPLIFELTTTIRLTEKYGGNVSEKLAIISEEAHKRRWQRAQDLAQRSSLGLLVPLLIFHFPVAVVIFLAPMVLSLRALFGP